MDETAQRKLIGRLHRLQGQVKALERQLSLDQQQSVIIQIEAVIAAARSVLVEYTKAIYLNQLEIDKDAKKTLERLLKKFS